MPQRNKLAQPGNYLYITWIERSTYCETGRVHSGTAPFVHSTMFFWSSDKYTSFSDPRSKKSPNWLRSSYQQPCSCAHFLSLTSWTDFLRPSGSKRLRSSGKPLFPQEPQSPQGLHARKRMLFPIIHLPPHFGIHLLVIIVQYDFHSLNLFEFDAANLHIISE